MKVLMINGSAKKEGCTFTALTEIAETLKQEGIESEIIQTGGAPVRDCIGCGKCREQGGKCVFNDDIVNEIIEKAKDADGFIFGTPVFLPSVNFNSFKNSPILRFLYFLAIIFLSSIDFSLIERSGPG